MILSVAFFLTTALPALQAQPSINMMAKESAVIIRGTSSLHDWEEKVEKFNVNLDLKFMNTEIADIEKAYFVCSSASITSDYSLMTSKTHDALNAEKYPRIIFNMVSVDNFTSSNGKFSGTLTGDLQLAGITKRISIPFTGHNGNERIVFSGTKDLNMLDFNIKPPTAMLGTLKTGDKISIDFVLQFQIDRLALKN